jgi:hypothetical protein
MPRAIAGCFRGGVGAALGFGHDPEGPVCRLSGRFRLGRALTAAANSPRHRVTPIILFPNGNVSATSPVGTVGLLLTPSISPPLLIGPSAFCLSALTPMFTSLRAFKLRVANADLRATVCSNTKIDLRLSERGCGDQEAGANHSSGAQSNSLHVANPTTARRPTAYTVLSKAWP